MSPWVSASADLETRLVTPADGRFPAALRAVRPAVKMLWFRGDLPRKGEPAVAIVGARAASLPACRLAAELAGVAARAGFAVVSGGALGIDGAAHAGALDAGGRTFAVLGCGVDVVYPDRHAALFQQIARGGGLLSDFPPGTEAHRRHFPSRNRLVAALARAVLVVQARQLSGALITARLATRMNRPLYAVAGSAGTDALIAAGKAQALRDAADWFAVLTEQPRPLHVPPQELAAVIAAVRGGAAAPQVALQLALPLPVALALLSEAELAGWILRGPGGVYTSTEVTLAS